MVIVVMQSTKGKVVMKRAKVESVEGYLPFVAIEIAEANRVRLAEKEAKRAWKAAFKRGYKAAKAKVEGPIITAADRAWVKSWLRAEAGKVVSIERAAERAKWAGYFDHICRFTGVAAVNQLEAA